MFSKLTSRVTAGVLGTGVLVLVSGQALAVVPPVETFGAGAIAICSFDGTNNVAVQHFDKIIFQIDTQLQPAPGADPAALAAIPRMTPLDIKVRDNPRAVADLKAKVLTFLMAAVTPANRAAIRIIDVDYSTICARLGPTPVPTR